MGIAVSRYADLSSNELLTRFCSNEVFCPNDPFWNQLLSFNITPPITNEEQLTFDSSTDALLQNFLQNNLETGNLGSLVKVFITRATELLSAPNSDSVMLAWQTFNALFVIRSVTKYLVEMVPEYEVCKHLDVQLERRSSDSPPSESSPEHNPSPSSSTDSRVEMLVDALIGIIIDVPVTDNTYFLHLECLNTLLVIMSVSMFAGVHGQTRVIETSLIYRTLYQGRYGLAAPLLVKTLLSNMCAMRPAPDMFGATDGGSLLISLAAGLWNIITMNSSAYQTIYSHPPADRHELLERLKSEHPVANQSCLVLLALTNHCINENNLYRQALLNCEDAQEPLSTTPQKEANGVQVTPRIDMTALHKALCATAGCEHSTLLLYVMLHACKAYRRHVSNDPNIENLIVPILKVLYNASDSNSHHIYMSLIVLLILTEDEPLIKNVHLIMLKTPTWYTERAISSISVGGMIVLIIVRALQYNMVRLRDKYLHTNCLAAAANMSSEFRNLHPYVAQRLVSLFETLSKRRARLCSEMPDETIPNNPRNDEIMDHISVLDEVLRMLLEIINSCLTHQLVNNLNMVYALLHKRDLFQQHQHHHITQNIQMVIGYFSTRLQRVQDGAGGDLSVTEVLQVIKKGAEQWSSDRLKKFPDLKFRYVEEEDPEQFFTPYVWGLIGACGAVRWSSEGGARVLADMLA